MIAANHRGHGMPFLQELRRRNVFRAATAYAAGSWLLVQWAGTALPAFGLGDHMLTVALAPFDWKSPYLKHFFAGLRGREILRRYGVTPQQLAGIRFSVQLPGELR